MVNTNTFIQAQERNLFASTCIEAPCWNWVRFNLIGWVIVYQFGEGEMITIVEEQLCCCLLV